MDEPAVITVTCGENFLSFCVMVTRRGAAEAVPDKGFSHTTIPEKSWRFFTAGSRESRSSTRPVTVAAERGTRLKKISQRHIIVIIEPRRSPQERGPHLRGFDSQQQIRPQAINSIRGVGEIARDLACEQIGGPIALLPTEYMQRETRSEGVLDL